MRDLIGWSTRREKSNAPRFAQLLRARRERPRHRRTAKREYELSPFVVDCHATLPWGVMPMQWRDITTL
jgi:hypothetical protein